MLSAAQQHNCLHHTQCIVSEESGMSRLCQVVCNSIAVPAPDAFLDWILLLLLLLGRCAPMWELFNMTGLEGSPCSYVELFPATRGRRAFH